MSQQYIPIGSLRSLEINLLENLLLKSYMNQTAKIKIFFKQFSVQYMGFPKPFSLACFALPLLILLSSLMMPEGSLDKRTGKLDTK